MNHKLFIEIEYTQPRTESHPRTTDLVLQRMAHILSQQYTDIHGRFPPFKLVKSYPNATITVTKGEPPQRTADDLVREHRKPKRESFI
jgi:hypothetical protein